MDIIRGCDGNDTFDTYYAPGSGTVVYGGPGEDCIEANSNVTVYCNISGDNTDGVVDYYDSDGLGVDNCSGAGGDGDVDDASLVCA